MNFKSSIDPLDDFGVSLQEWGWSFLISDLICEV